MKKLIPTKKHNNAEKCCIICTVLRANNSSYTLHGSLHGVSNIAPMTVSKLVACCDFYRKAN